jgi:copper transport protein
VPGERGAIAVAVPPLGRGVYTVSWRVVSAADGHATAGAFVFGVGVAPAQGVSAQSSTPQESLLEVVGRWLFLVGVMALLGASVADVAGFGRSRATRLVLAGGGLAVSAAGLVVLAVAEVRTAGTSFSGLLGTSIGRALLWRGAALAGAGVALGVALRGQRAHRRAAMAAVAGCSSLAVVAHVLAGHAGAGTTGALGEAAQTAHVVAGGVWLGGLAALLISVRGAPSAAKGQAVRRFSAVALAGLAVLAATGILRSVEELSSWSDLALTGYGRAIVVKIALLVAIAALGLRNRLRSVPVAALSLRPLRRTSTVELTAAIAAVAAAAVLATLAPPAGRAVVPFGLAASGRSADGRTTVDLRTASSQPGPNAFSVHVRGSKRPAERVLLRFRPLDDPGVRPSQLLLRPAPDGQFVGSGDGLEFDGRWAVSVHVTEGAASETVPLELDVPGPAQFVSVQRGPGAPPLYTVDLGGLGSIRFSPDPERGGASRLFVTCYDVFGDETPIDRIVVTAAAGKGPVRTLPVRRLGAGRFVAAVRLDPGTDELAAVARTPTDTRLRAAVEVDVPSS